MTEINALIKPHLVSHKKTLDPDNIRDFMDLYLTEIQNTTDPKSTMYGKKGEANLINAFVDLFLGGIETTSSTLLWAILILVHFPGKNMKKVSLKIQSIMYLLIFRMSNKDGRRNWTCCRI